MPSRKRMSWVVSAAFYLLLSLSISSFLGCVTSGEGEKIWKEIDALKNNQESLQADRQRLAETLERSNTEIESLESVLKEAREVLSVNNANLGAEMIEVRKAIDRLTGQLETAKRDHDKLVREFDLFVKDIDSRLGGSGGAGGPLPSDKNELWSEAEKRFSSSKWMSAREAFLAFVRDHKKDKRADNAQLHVGETFLNEGQYADAILAFRKVLENFNRSDVKDVAVFKSANAFAGLGQCDNARALYEAFLSEYPRSKFRRDANAKVASIKKTGTCR